MPKLLPHLRDHRLANLMLLIKRLIIVALLGARITADGGNIDHAVAELDEGAALDGDVEVGDVVEDPADELLVGLLADPLDEAVGRQLGAELVRRQPVLAEAEVEHRGHRQLRRRPQLFFLLHEVGTADEADGDFLPQLLERPQHLGARGAARGGEGLVDVE